jgi:hypothetical protein
MKSTSILVLVAGGILAIWGFSYTASHDLQSGLREIYGSGITSDKFEFAVVAGPLGAGIAVVGFGDVLDRAPQGLNSGRVRRS